MIDFKKYKRFFAFGCSMTSYGWPTWADIVAHEIPESYNYAQSGGGNLFISCQVTEANLRHKFTDSDLVMVMWSSTAREDRHINGNWLTPGNIYTQNYYDDTFVNKFADELGYLLRDINLITLTKNFLDTSLAEYFMLNMSPFKTDCRDHVLNAKYNDIKKIYRETFNSILPDILSLELNGTWPQHPISKAGHQSADYHPSPIQHFGYLKKLFPEARWSNTTLEFVKNEQAQMEKLRNFDDMIFKTPLLRI
jgi:hypothetical protein